MSDETVAMTLTDFLLARIAEDEATLDGTYNHGDQFTLDPQRMSRDCEAKRAIVEYATGQHTSSPEGYDILCLLAAVYADHPDYRDEWRA